MNKTTLALAGLLSASQVMAELSWDAQIDYEVSGYFNDSAAALSADAQDKRLNNSLVLQGEVYKAWADETQSITFKPFYRFDEMDDERSHGDVRELMWHLVADEYELKAGIGKVFWGVTESAHLVDIVNQTDGLESIDGEEKLGQPMVQLLLERDWGNLDLFVLPYHREREFASADGRLSTGVSFADAIYETDNEEANVDVAARFYSYIDDFEYAVSMFHGNSRDPQLAFDFVANELVPYYSEITQVGLEVQYLNEGWAWKFEGIHRDGNPGQYAYEQTNASGSLNVNCLTCEVESPYPGVSRVLTEDKSYFATAAGFEYTQVGIFETRVDLGWVVEHLYDSRQEDAGAGAFEHDLLLATRWAANDEADSTLLAGVLYDYENSGYSLSVEGTTRIMDGLSLELEARVFAPDEDDSLYNFRDEDFVKLTFSYYL